MKKEKNYAKLYADVVAWTRDWFAKNGGETPRAVIGISGGKDSLISAKICADAIGSKNVWGIMMPNHVQSDLDDAKECIKVLGINSKLLPIGDITDSFYESIGATWAQLSSSVVYSDFAGNKQSVPITKQAAQNLPPRVRTAMLRFITQCLGGRFVNTCNLSENKLGYFTIGGDGDGDVSPLGNLTCTEVKQLGIAAGLPYRLVMKAPDDGLPHSSKDEEKFGFSYAALDAYILGEDTADTPLHRKMQEMIDRNAYKSAPMCTFTP